MATKPIAFACDRCRAGKRKCDAGKPVCSLCLRQGRECVYTEASPRKRKYWDESYVKGLEAQVQSLLAVLNAQNEALPAPSPAIQPAAPRISPSPEAEGSLVQSEDAAELAAPPDARSHQAMDELCVMLWRTNIGDGVTIINDPESGSRYTLDSAQRSSGLKYADPPATVVAYCQNMGTLHEISALFLENINSEHQFTPYKSTGFLDGFPYQEIHDTLLHSAIIAVGATFSTKPGAMALGDAFAEFAESLIFSSCRHNPSVKVVQALSMLSWRSLALGRDHMGWIFISLAAGMCVHLRLHVLALDECDARRLDADEQDIRTFWMFYIIDRTAISILGRNCSLPWRRINVPSFGETFASRTASLTEVAFAGQCELWYLHDRYMDRIFSSAFDTLPVSQQIHTLVSCQHALNDFRLSVDDRLQYLGPATHKAVLLFHLAYEMAILISMPPFLRVFARLKDTSLKQPPSQEPTMDLMLPVLRSLTSAATQTVRLVRDYVRGKNPEIPANPVLIHHLLSAGIVHLMNATSQTPAVSNHSGYCVRECLRLLRSFQAHWPSRSDRSIKVIRVLAQRWRVTSCLPLDLSHRVDPSVQNHRPGDAVEDILLQEYSEPSFLQGEQQLDIGGVSEFWSSNLSSLDVDSMFASLDPDDVCRPVNPTYGATSAAPGVYTYGTGPL